MALTEKKRRFVAAVRAGLTGAKAAIDAGYSEKGAAQAASRLMKDKAVATTLAGSAEVNKSVGAVNKPRVPKPQPPAAGFTTPDGTKSAAAPPDWPFGSAPPPAPSAPVTPPAADAPAPAPGRFDDPRLFLMHVMNDPEAEPKERLDAAKALLPFEHPRLAPRGKKEAKDNAAARESSRFGAPPPPKLVVNNRT